MKYWEIIADNLSKAGWSWGCVSAVDSSGRTIWIADAHRDDGKHFVVRAELAVGNENNAPRGPSQFVTVCTKEKENRRRLGPQPFRIEMDRSRSPKGREENQ